MSDSFQDLDELKLCLRKFKELLKDLSCQHDPPAVEINLKWTIPIKGADKDATLPVPSEKPAGPGDEPK